jgi:hypothetical protein
MVRSQTSSWVPLPTPPYPALSSSLPPAFPELSNSGEVSVGEVVPGHTGAHSELQEVRCRGELGCVHRPCEAEKAICNRQGGRGCQEVSSNLSRYDVIVWFDGVPTYLLLTWRGVQLDLVDAVAALGPRC